MRTIVIRGLVGRGKGVKERKEGQGWKTLRLVVEDERQSDSAE
jgi:hypothetical protein